MSRLSLLALWLLCQLLAPVAALRALGAIATNPARARRILLAYDKLGNAAANDDCDQTISRRAYQAQQSGKRWGCLLCRLLDRIDPGHCARATE